MKILLINGSPREGNTARVLEALAARLGGHDVETLRLGELGIRGCIGCLRCQQDVEHFVCHQTLNTRKTSLGRSSKARNLEKPL